MAISTGSLPTREITGTTGTAGSMATMAISNSNLPVTWRIAGQGTPRKLPPQQGKGYRQVRARINTMLPRDLHQNRPRPRHQPGALTSRAASIQEPRALPAAVYQNQQAAHQSHQERDRVHPLQDRQRKKDDVKRIVTGKGFNVIVPKIGL